MKTSEKLSSKKLVFWAILAVLILGAPVLLQTLGLVYPILIGCYIEMYVIAVSGLDLCFGYSGQISMGHAGFYAIGAYGAGLLHNLLGVPAFLSILIATAVATLVGAINGIVIAKVNIPPLIMTYAMQMVLSGCAYILCKGLPIYGFTSKFTVIGQGYVWKIPIPVIIMAVCLIIGAFVLSKTFFGRYFYEVGGNEEASRLSGINVTFV